MSRFSDSKPAEPDARFESVNPVLMVEPFRFSVNAVPLISIRATSPSAHSTSQLLDATTDRAWPEVAGAACARNKSRG